jgi:serine/threonine protein kinase/tetratricopeptide (TPR) repeat protein
MEPWGLVGCLSDEAIAQLAEGRLSADDARAAEHHLAECSFCRAIAGQVSASRSRGDAESQFAPGESSLAPVDPNAYDVGREVARGGMGRVLVAWDRRHMRRVAIKVLLKQGTQAKQRFLREVRITARLQHPSIVPLYEAGLWEGGEPFYAMRLVRGRPLDMVVAETTTLRERLALLPNVVALTEALAYAHGERIVHRDLKPANVLIGAFGETVVIDWGLAKELGPGERLAGADALPPSSVSPTSDTLPGPTGGSGSGDELTKAGHVLGTLAYMAPEQLVGRPVDTRADVFALGALLYHVLTGKPPYDSHRRGTRGTPLAAPKPIAVAAPGVPEDLAAVVRKAMAVDPKDRYATAKQLADDLRRFVTGDLVSAYRYTLGVLAKRWVARHKTLVAMAALLVAAVGLTAGLSVRRIVRERDRADAAKLEADAQRASAVAQRDAAEKLASYMIGELRDRLEALGKLDLLAGVATEVQAYYGALGPDADSSDLAAFQRRAAALGAVASVEAERRDFAAAEALLRAEVALSDAVRRRTAGNLEAAILGVTSRTDLAGTLSRSGRLADAVAVALEADAAGAELVAEAPLDSRVLLAAARATAGAGHLLAQQGKLDEARAYARRSQEQLAKLGASPSLDSARYDEMATTYGKLADVWTTTADWPSCAETFHTHNAFRREQLKQTPDHVGYGKALAFGLRGYGFALQNLGSYDEAIAAYHESIAIRAALLANEPQNLTLAYEQAGALAMLCDLELPWHGPIAAAETCAEARAQAERVLARRPNDVKAQDVLSRALRASGNVSLAAKRNEEALVMFQGATEWARRVRASEPTVVQFGARVSLSLGLVGAAETALNRTTEADPPLREALAIAEARLAEASDDVYFEWLVAWLYTSLGDVAGKRGLLDEARVRYGQAVDYYGRALAADANDDVSAVELAKACRKLAAIEGDATRKAALRARASELIAALLAAGRLAPQARAELDAAGRGSR